MKTVVLIINRQERVADANQQGLRALARNPNRNILCTRTLHKMAFIDDSDPMAHVPRVDEHWLVEIVRENLSSKPQRGSFILKPLECVATPASPENVCPLLHGMYDVVPGPNRAIIVMPHTLGKYWVLSPKAKHVMLTAYANAPTIVINHGGDIWPQRPSPSAHLLSSVSDIIRPDAVIRPDAPDDDAGADDEG